jgi:ferric-chelate reductase
MRWVEEELGPAVERARAGGIDADVQIHVTCDDGFTSGVAEPGEKICGCQCDKRLGPCCCTTTPNAEIQELGNTPASELLQQTSSRNPPAIPLSGLCTYQSGRPTFEHLIWELADRAEGEMAIATCGPLGLSMSVRNTVARVSDQRGVHKGSGALGIYLHVEGFCW